MGRKMGFPSLFKTRNAAKFSSSSSSSPSWTWPSCQHPRTDSFRARDREDMYKTVNSMYFDTSESWFTNSSEAASESFSSSGDSRGESLETVIRGLRSDRLFFEPGDTSSILEESKAGGSPFKESVVLAMESEDPYSDFRESMEEMVMAHGLKDWEFLEGLLEWYLRVNGKKTHEFIVGAFVDLLLELASVSSSSTTTPSSSSLSFFFEVEAKEEESGSCC